MIESDLNFTELNRFKMNSREKKKFFSLLLIRQLASTLIEDTRRHVKLR